MDRPRPQRGAQTVLEPLEEVSQRDIDMLVNAAWNPDDEEQISTRQNDLMSSTMMKDSPAQEKAMPSDSHFFSRRQRSLSHEVNNDPSNPVLNFVQDMINKSERSNIPLEHKDIKDRVISKFGMDIYLKQSLAINLLFRSIEEQSCVQDELISISSRDRTLSISSGGSFGGYDSPFLSTGNFPDACIGCSDPEMETQLRLHLLEIEALV
eukprot:g8339.t1